MGPYKSAPYEYIHLLIYCFYDLTVSRIPSLNLYFPKLRYCNNNYKKCCPDYTHQICVSSFI